MSNESWKNNHTLRIGEVLIEQGLLSVSDVEEILLEQQTTRKPFGVIAEWICGISMEAIEEAWASQYARNAKTVDPTVYIPRENARAVISTRQAWQFRCLPMNIEGDTLVIATTRNHLHRALKFATRVLEMPAYFVFTSEGQLAAALSDYYPLGGMESSTTNSDTMKHLMQKLRMERIRKAG